MQIYMYMYTYIELCIQTPTHAIFCVYIHTYVDTLKYLLIKAGVYNENIYTYININTCTYACVHSHSYIYMYMYTYMYAMSVHIYIYI